MALRTKLQATASRLIGKFGDTVNLLTVTTSPGATQFDPPTVSSVSAPVPAIVTGAGSLADGVTILHSDKVVLVSGAYDVAPVGGKITIDGVTHAIIERKDILATGVKSAVKYIVRH